MPWWRRGPEQPGDPGISRRDFFKRFGGGAAELIRPTVEATRRPPPSPMLPHRPLGNTGVTVPILGFGTARLTQQIPDDDAAAALLAEAIDLGVTLVDTGSEAGGYGRSQVVVGEVLKQRRLQVFLTAKVFEPDGAGAWRMLEQSLRDLQVQEVDLLYAHSLGHDHMDPEVVFGPNGVLAMLRQARYEGLCRFVGATCHNRSARLLRALEEFELDVIMTPANLADAHTYHFEEQVWPLARRKGTGLLAMKVFGGPAEGVHTPARMPRQLQDVAFRYALSQEGCASAVIGMLNRHELHENIQRARTFQPLSEEEWQRMREIGPDLAATWGAHLGEV